MDGQNGNRRRAATLLSEVAVHEGIHPTPVDGVWVARPSTPRPRTPAVYEPMIVVVGQGQSQGYPGGDVYAYDPFHYLVLSVPLPVEEAEQTRARLVAG